MEVFKREGRRLSNLFSEASFNLDSLKGSLFRRKLSGSLSERMIRRYSTLSENDLINDTSKAQSKLERKVCKKPRATLCKSNSFDSTQTVKCLSAEEVGTNNQRLSALADLMSVFADEDDISSDQDDLIEELQDMGYLITRKDSDDDDNNNDLEHSSSGDNLWKSTIRIRNKQIIYSDGWRRRRHSEFS